MKTKPWAARLVSAACLMLAAASPGSAGTIDLVIKDSSGLQSGPWLSSMETGDVDVKWRPILEVTFTIGGESRTRRYQRSIGGDNPLAYFIADDQSPGNFYDHPDGDNYRGHKYGDSFLIKRFKNRVGFFRCDISDIPPTAVVTAVRFRGHVEPDEGRSTVGTLEIYRCVKPWTKTSITKEITDYTGERITELNVDDSTFVKGSDWWIWDWDARLIAYAQEIVRQNRVGHSETGRPNVLVIITDQQSADTMSSRMGDRYLQTPNMDALAARGVSFTKAYCANAICIPSRTSMLTGRYPHETKIQSNERVAFDAHAFPTAGVIFKQAGYDTGYVGKWHLPYPCTDPASGFDYTANLRGNGADVATPGAVTEFLSQRRDRPFLLFASFNNPHNICEWARGEPLPDGPIGDPPRPEDCPPAPVNLAPQEDEPDAMAFARRSYHANPQFPVGGFDAEKWRQYRWAYYRMIEKVDSAIGEVLAALRASGHADTTVIVFTSDHGDCQGAHGWNQKTVFYDESSRVPFIVCAPETAAPGTTSDRLVQTGIDLLPTLCDYAGIAIPPELGGLSVRATAAGIGRPDPRRYVVASNHLVQGAPVNDVTMTIAGRMLRSARYKYCVYDQGERRESLVDMERDPGEMRNLATDPAYEAVLQEHRQMLAEWSRQTGDTGFPLISSEFFRRLQ